VHFGLNGPFANTHSKFVNTYTTLCMIHKASV